MNRIFLIIAAQIFLASCAASSVLRYPPARWIRDTDRDPIHRPSILMKQRQQSETDLKSAIYFDRLLDLTERLGGFSTINNVSDRQEATNVNNFDEAPDSTWFTNRLGRQRMTPEEIALKKDAAAPDTNSPLLIVALNNKSSNPVFIAKDSRGKIYLLRFDPPDQTEMVSGAEIIFSRVLRAAGFNVPKNFIVSIDAKKMNLDAGAEARDRKGVRTPLTREGFNATILKLTPDQSGKLRALASHLPDGEPIGTFSFRGRRSDDPNDRISHEHRRELRGYRVFLAFLDRKDVRGSASLDVFVPTDGEKGFIMHYLSDLARPIGSLDSLAKMEWSLASDPFETTKPLSQPSPFGFYNPKTQIDTGSKPFIPQKWRPDFSNPAFEYMTLRDGFWAAKILMNLSDGAIEAIVDEANYSDPNHERALTQELISRRNKIGEYWFSKLNPLDNFRIEYIATETTVGFDDLAVFAKFARSNESNYRYRLRNQTGKIELKSWQETLAPQIQLTDEMTQKMKQGKIYTLQIQTLRSDDKYWSPSVDLFIRKQNGTVELMGLNRRYFH